MYAMPLLHSGVQFDVSQATLIASPGSQTLITNKMDSVFEGPAYTLTDTANLPYVEVFNFLNTDGFVLKSNEDYEMILEFDFDTANTSQSYDVVFFRCDIDESNVVEGGTQTYLARFSSNNQKVQARQYVTVNLDSETTRNNFVWSIENQSVSSGAPTAVQGTWRAYIIEARREIN
mgnify:FL=1